MSEENHEVLEQPIVNVRPSTFNIKKSYNLPTG